jgi:hypothetical protein
MLLIAEAPMLLLRRLQTVSDTGRRLPQAQAIRELSALSG